MKLRVLSYNIHKGIGGVDRKYAPDRTIATISHYAPDVVLLQEVDEAVKRSSHHKQVELFGDALGMPYRAFFANVDVRGGGSYGNAVLSRFPIVTAHNHDLTVSFKKRRSVIAAEIRIRHDSIDRTIHVFNMHLGLAEYERRRQLVSFLECRPFANLSHETPVILGGDFNDVWGGLGEVLIPAGFRGWETPPRTFPAWAPMRALDSIYVRGAAALLELKRGDIEVAKRASDHRPLIADIVLTPSHPKVLK